MKVAVLTLTRDRLHYTKQTFSSLRRNAGCAFDHFVLDQASEDGTRTFLHEYGPDGLWLMGQNIGIARGLNLMLETVERRGYDVIVNFDNDCEVVTPDTLKVVTEIAVAHPGFVIGPKVQGLRNPPALAEEINIDGYRVGPTVQVGGILMPIPAGWRYPITESYTYGDAQVCARAREQGHTVGQLLDYTVNHIETTDGQHERYPEYFAVKRSEGIPD